ncbi:hypothetical protein [Fulvivirga sedimenti]|uniref:Uncharacterized protein n=1 Tax=Fulvivirga sedimenti TaxID=2879465 RepID=A0A9X1KZ45_9BACT|nr:hypothetical protein [Fulvivirga sedimenti]MCA6075520.1 hypothetical protein [Fulvivirga sedimenti]MCA6076697.1 hypothetical protein [Fulvivirga sedimenti]MCA6077825.1 hypothetical protein [Fulvivirga sedimenti]
MKITPVLIIFTLCIATVSAQNTDRIKPGVLYKSGETINSPKYGFTATIPQEWSGFLPQGTEVFALAKNDGTSGEVVLLARENSNLETLEAAWEQGGNLTDGIRIKAADVQKEGDMIFSEVTAEGENINKSYRGFIIGKCGGFGPCVSLFMITPSQFFEGIRDEMLSLMRSGQFSEPGEANIYSDFDWQRFLANKTLVAFELMEFSKKQNTIDLCVNGTFRSQVKQSGWFKQNGSDYKGKNGGTWSVRGKGPQTILRLEFNDKKLLPLEIVLRIEEEKIYANDERYYAGYSLRCN